MMAFIPTTIVLEIESSTLAKGPYYAATSLPFRQARKDSAVNNNSRKSWE